MTERRYQISPLNNSEGRKIVGYASVFNSPAQINDISGRQFTEVIRPGAFSRAMREGQDVVALYNHSLDNLLGRTSSNTLRLIEDTRGLYFSVDTPDTPLGNSLLELIKRGDLRGASFGFNVKGERWSKGTTPTREITDVDLVDVSIVTHPAYASTSVDVRSMLPTNYYKLRLLLSERDA